MLYTSSDLCSTQHTISSFTLQTYECYYEQHLYYAENGISEHLWEDFISYRNVLQRSNFS